MADLRLNIKIMKRGILSILWFAVAASGSLWAQRDDGFRPEDNLQMDQRVIDEMTSREFERKGKSPKLDPKRIINESNAFLKEREPEMTAEEYALYEKVATMLSTNPPFALRLLEAMVGDKAKPSPAFEFILGNAYYAAGEYGKAEASYKVAVERYPTFLRAWNNLGVLYYSMDRFGDAARCFSKTIGLGDRDPMTLGLLGYSLEQESNFISAEMAYMQALVGDPANTEWKEGLLRLCIKGRQYARAEAVVRNLIKEQPQEPRFWLIYANILISDQRKLEAMAILEAAARLGVAGADQLVLLGDLYAEQKLFAEATGIYEKLLERTPETGQGKLLHFARVLIADGKVEQAERVLGVMKGELPSPVRLTLLQTRADLYAAKKQWSDARRELEALLAIAPLDGPALMSLGRVYVAEENVARAMFAFEAAYGVPGTTYRASLELANLQLKNRDYAASVKYLEKALSLHRTDAVQDYLSRIKTLVAQAD